MHALVHRSQIIHVGSTLCSFQNYSFSKRSLDVLSARLPCSHSTTLFLLSDAKLADINVCQACCSQGLCHTCRWWFEPSPSPTFLASLLLGLKSAFQISHIFVDPTGSSAYQTWQFGPVLSWYRFWILVDSKEASAAGVSCKCCWICGADSMLYQVVLVLNRLARFAVGGMNI